MLDDFGLAQTIEWHVNKFSSRTGLNSEFNQSGKIREPSRSVSIYLFRVIKELMNNALKHADADKIKVELIGSDSGMKVIVSDDGKGFNAESVFESAYDMRGLGLYSIREWVSGVGGQLKIESVSGKGTKVIIDILIDVKK
jgi:signal transduction histidine kinase